jgi:endonuclease/exonuclease/phosphatase family metal-dependent hydrolase
VGTDSTLDLASWNLEFFPIRLPGDFDCPHPNDPARITKLAELITTLNLDVIAVQEVSEPNGFAELMAMLPGYEGALTPEFHGCNYQRTGVIYRTDIVTLHSFRTLNELSQFTREPFLADMTVTQSGKSYHFRLISLHLKAGGEEDAPRRRSETNQLHAYLDARAAAEPGVDYIVAGDWNDVLTDPPANSSFPAFLADDESYTFVTDPLKNQSIMASLGTRLIDLILINESACADFARARVSTLRLDLMVPGYSSLVSDHRPVMVSTPVFN